MNPLSRTHRSLLAIALALALPAAPALAQDSPYSQTVFFGDSLSDSGHFRPALIQLLGPDGALLGEFTTNPGLVWSQYLADYYGTDATSDNQGGENYAVGGARVDVDTAGGLGPIPSMATQVNAYLAANGGRADPNALYSVWGGANDLFTIVDPATAPAVIGEAVTGQIGIIGTLQAAGAQYVLVPTIPDLGLAPAFSGDPVSSATGTQLAAGYNAALFGGLASANLRVIPLDTFHLLQEIVANPGLYGFSNATDPACLPQPAPAGDSSLFCNPASYTSPDAGTGYVFADGVHPSTGAHAVLAQYAESVLEGPRQIAALPHSEAVVGRARADRIAGRLAQPLSGEGMRWWVDVRGDSQRYGQDVSTYDGMGPTVSAGVDWTSGQLVYGGFLGYGRQSIDFGRQRGDYDQTDASLGGYLGWRGEHGWVSGQLGYSWLNFDIDRDIQLGAATRTHHGSTDGSNLTAGVDAGWDFTHSNWRHGPVVSVLSQQVDVDGYAENDPGLSTSLAYPDQSFDSLIGSVGWQFSWEPTDRIHPYARVTWDHEFQEAPTQAFAMAQSIPGSMAYAVPGLDFDRNYGTLLLGARTSLMGLEANFGASATFAQESGNDATLFVTVGSGF